MSREEKKKQTSDVVGDSQSGHVSKLTRHSCGYSTKTMIPGCLFGVMSLDTFMRHQHS